MLLEPMQRGDVRVIELGKESSFALEPIQAFLVSRKLFRQNFDGNVSSELRISCPINFSHSTYTNRLDDFILAEFCA